MKKQEDAKHNLSITIDSWDEFVERATIPGKDGDEETCASLVQSNRHTEWTQSESFDHAVDMLIKTGWPEGMRRVIEVAQTIPFEGCKTLRSEAQWSECGDECDVDRFLTGEPEHMICYQAQNVDEVGKIYRITLDPCVSQDVHTDSIFARGVVALSLYNKIVEAGGSCEVVIAASHAKSHRSGSARSVITFPVCSSDKPMSVDRLAFALCHPAFFRRIIFRLWETQYNATQRERFQVIRGKGYGHVESLKTTAKDGEFVIGTQNGQDAWPTDPKRLAKVVTQLLNEGIYTPERDKP